MNICYRAPVSALLLLSALAAAPAYAQETLADSGRDILVVGQKGTPITIEPRGLSVSLGDDQFAGVNAFNTEDLIKYAPDFFVHTRFIGDNNAVRSEEHTSELQSLMRSSYAVFCLKKKTDTKSTRQNSSN